jgi:hypothetical protein
MNAATITPADELELMRQAYDIGTRDGTDAGERTAEELFTGPDAETVARQCLADIADGSPDLWQLMPPPATDEDAWSLIYDAGHDVTETPAELADAIAGSYDDGYGAGWVERMKRHAELHLALFADFETVTH